MRSILLIAMFSFSLLAQEKKTAAPPDLASMMPKPAAEMKVLTDMVGTWDVDEKMEASPMMPGGMVGKGVATYTAGPGGLSVMIDYKSSTSPFRGHGVMTWDAIEKVYKTFWTDNMTAGGMVSTGKKEGNQYVYTYNLVMGGQTFPAKDIVELGPNTMTNVTTVNGQTTMTLKYKKR